MERHRERFETALRNLHAGLSKPGYLKNLEKVQRKVGRLIEEYKRVASQYEVQVSPGEKGKAKAVTFRHKPQQAAADAAAGAYMLRTYWTLTEVESTFRELKSSLGLRPIWHRLDRQISGHLFIAVLAYHAVHLIRTRVKARGASELGVDPQPAGELGAHHDDAAGGGRIPDLHPAGRASGRSCLRDLAGRRGGASPASASDPLARRTKCGKCSAKCAGLNRASRSRSITYKNSKSPNDELGS